VIVDLTAIARKLASRAVTSRRHVASAMSWAVRVRYFPDRSAR
jgi:hypothetical protein